MKFKIDDRVVKARPYSLDKYCCYGGDKSEIPLGTKGVISAVYDDGKYKVDFDNGRDWSVDVKELDLNNRKPLNPTHLVVWEEDTDPCRFFESEDKAKEFIKELSEKSEVKKESIVLVEIKSAKKVNVQKSLRYLKYTI